MTVSCLYVLMTKSDMIGVRIPSDLLSKLDYMRNEEGIDRTALILRALRYWATINGKVTTDNEYIKRLNKIENDVGKIADEIDDVKQIRELVSEQQKVISALVKMIPKEE